LAARQSGVVSHVQLLGLGLSPDDVRLRRERGRLHVLHRGVYAVGHRVVRAEGRRWAGLLALGPDAFLSHHTAADAFDIQRSDSPLVHVTVRGRAGRARRAGIRVHRPRALPDGEVTVLRGMPITTPARTLLDLAGARLRADLLAKALDQAHRLKLIDFAELRELLARYHRRPGTHSLNAQLSRYRGFVDTRSELERLVNKLCDDHGLPSPLVNCVIEGKVRDFYWPQYRLVVEADSYSFHSSPSALNDDRERDVELTLAGYATLRFTWEQVAERPNYVVSALLQALGAS
jgi:very-short-patch-repair endonuclease